MILQLCNCQRVNLLAVDVIDDHVHRNAIACQPFAMLFLVSPSNPFYLHTEHRNMPLDDAMRLVGQNFDQYMQDLRERAKSSSTQESSNTKTTAPQEAAKSDITSLLSKAASGEDLSADQLTKLIDNLSKRQEQILGDSTAANGKGGNDATYSFPALNTVLRERQSFNSVTSYFFSSQLFKGKNTVCSSTSGYDHISVSLRAVNVCFIILCA